MNPMVGVYIPINYKVSTIFRWDGHFFAFFSMSLSCCKRAKSRQKPPEVGLPGKGLALRVENHWMMKSSGLMEPRIFWRVDEGKGWQFIRAFIGVK